MSRSIHLGLGVIAATAAVALAPSTASAATCAHDILNQDVNVQMTTNQIVVQSVNGQIVIGEPGGAGKACGQRSFVDKIVIRSANPPGFDRVIVDESFGKFHGINVAALTGTGGDNIVVNGSGGDDTYTAMLGLGANINMGAGTLTSSAVGTITLNGNGGRDTLFGGPFGNNGPTAGGVNSPVQMNGGAGPDVLIAGRSGRDVLDGGPDPDFVRTDQGRAGDRAIGGFGPGDHILADTSDTASGFETGGIGGAKPGSIRAHSGKAANVRLSWSHPTSWKKLGSLTLSAYNGEKKVGTVELAPGTGRVAARGDMELAGHGPLSRKGKKVSVTLKLKFADRLDGKKLDLRMQPEDRGTSGR